MNTETIDVLIVGAGGYGGQYVRALLSQGERHGLRIAGVAEPYPDTCREKETLLAMGVPWYASPEEFYVHHRADLALISSPIQFHKRQVMTCLTHGSHVLCEKPLCSSPEDLRELLAVRDASGRLLAVGYQWSYEPAIQALKADVIAGKFGALHSMKTLIRWPRDTAYFRRGIGWAGKVRAADGTWILDSIAHNACGHYLHNMFFTAGHAQDSCALPVEARATLLRANAIENYDTAMIRAVDQNGAAYLFIASHAVEENINPVFSYRFEKATVTYDENTDGHIYARYGDGTVKDYGGMGDRAHIESIHYPKLWHMAAAIRGEEPLLCPPEATRGHILTVCAAQKSMPVRDFPKEIVKTRGIQGQLFVAEGLAELLQRCYEENRLPGPEDPAWALPGRNVVTDSLDPFTLEV